MKGQGLPQYIFTDDTVVVTVVVCERGFPALALVHQNADCPVIDAFIVAPTEQNFGRHVLGRAAHGKGLVRHHLCKAKVDHLDEPLGVDHKVFWFQVAVTNVSAVNVLKDGHDTRAYELGYQALALTDECTYSGLVKAHIAAEKLSIKLIVGAEFSVKTEPDSVTATEKLILLAPTRSAYGQLSAFISTLRRRSDKGRYDARLNDFSFGLKDCIALWAPSQQAIDLQMALGRHGIALMPTTV